MRVALGVVVALALSACAPAGDRAFARDLRVQLAGQVHDCVPLGWNPVPVADSYVPGASAERDDDHAWVRALWLGGMRTADLRRPDMRAIAQTMDALTRAGLLQRRPVRGGRRYRLAVAALPYVFQDNQFGNNPAHITYLCASHLVVDRVVWRGPVRNGVFRAAFTWHATPDAPWADDPVLRARRVELGPTRSPALATFARDRDGWYVARLSTMDRSPIFPRVANAAVWPPLPPIEPAGPRPAQQAANRSPHGTQR